MTRLTNYPMIVTKPQLDFIQLRSKYNAFVGGFGTGKSQTMCNNALIDAREGGSNSLIALYQPTFDLIRLITAPRMMETLSEYGFRYRYNKSENMIFTSSPNIGDFIMRPMLEDRIIGYQSMRAHCDELDTLPLRQAAAVWRKVIARNRQRPRTYHRITARPLNTVSAYCTPEGFNFMYQQWAEKREDAEKRGYFMIQAPTASNPFLPLDYVESLRASYPAELIDAYLEGKFVNLSSGTIYRNYDKDRNRSRETVQDGETVYVGMDFNVGNMSAAIHVLRDGLPHLVEEICEAFDTPDMIEKLLARFGNRHRINVYPDSSGKNRSTKNASTSDIGLLEEAGFFCYYHETNPAVRSRVNAVNAMLLNGLYHVRYFVNDEACPYAVKCLTNQVYDEKTGEPDKKQGFDHMNDALGYFIAYEFPIIREAAYGMIDMKISY